MKKKLVGFTVSTMIMGSILFGGCSGAAATTASSTVAASSAASASAPSAASSSVADITKITMKDIVEANTNAKALSRHKNCLIKVNVSKDDKLNAIKLYGAYTYELYIEKDIALDYSEVYSESGNQGYKDAILTTKFGEYLYPDTGSSKKVYTYFYAMTDQEKKELRENNHALPERDVFSYNVEEGLESVKDNNDGTISVVSRSKIEEEYEEDRIPADWKGGDKEYTYTLKKDTLEMTGMAIKVIKDGKSYDYLTEEMTYDVEPPEDVTKLKELSKLVEEGTPKDPRTITYIYDPGTAKEEKFTVTVDSSVGLSAFFREGYKPYNDPEGKTEWTGGTADKKEVTVYLLKK